MTALAQLSNTQSVADSTQISWITGASSGLGKALALQLAQQGHWVIASARSPQGLAQLASDNSGPGRILTVVLDVTDRGSLLAASELINIKLGRIDRLIANAGSCEYLDFPHPDWSAIERVFAVNFNGAVATIEAALPLLRSNLRRGHIVGVVSQVVNAPFTRAEAYGASKAALSYFLSSLRLDLAHEIDVTAIYPGFVATPLTAQNDFSMPFLMNADDAATRMARAINKRAISLSFPRRLSASLWLARRLPSLWRRAMIKQNTPEKTP
ncbi:SDR family NAD(P)-dependent oxidoreductase [Gilvimarinus polysaccharolyticus]|uniref:SDR family NAD(P)-dependent oxidoreductase n=1 Tax=Gilvimarinus polysaccharolyticus TaxID=863921 RepID=UPI00067353FF|nr:SDR family NAD(P)-dependent oxidoreductase [Gilvimarinus polysaccharolyticus]